MTPRSETRAVRADVRVLPMRFTDNLRPMREFLALLGLSAKVTREESWVTMAADAGMVALHSLASTSPEKQGRTELWFETSDLEALRARYVAAGFEDLVVYDEAYGRELVVSDQQGNQVGFDEPSDDLYGYRLDQPAPEHGIVAMPILATEAVDALGRLLRPAGFVRRTEDRSVDRRVGPPGALPGELPGELPGDRGGGLGHGADRSEMDTGWAVWSGAANSGVGMVALHRPSRSAVAGSVRLGFRTQEPLAELAVRLRAAGHPNVTLSGGLGNSGDPGNSGGLGNSGGELTVLDPDGQPVLLRPH